MIKIVVGTIVFLLKLYTFIFLQFFCILSPKYFYRRQNRRQLYSAQTLPFTVSIAIFANAQMDFIAVKIAVKIILNNRKSL